MSKTGVLSGCNLALGLKAAKSKPQSNIISDITDGSLYCEMKQEGGFLHSVENSNNITMTCFTDGVPLFKNLKFPFGLCI